MRLVISILLIGAAVLVNTPIQAQNGIWSYLTRTNSQLSTDSINAVVISPNNHVWAGTNRGLQEYDGSTWTSYYHDPRVIDQYIWDVAYTNNALWVGCQGGMNKFDGTTWQTMTTTNSGLVNAPVTGLVPDRDQNLWVLTQRGLNRLRTNGTWDTYTRTNVPAMPYNGIIALATNQSNGDVWMAFINTRGLVKFPNGDATRAVFYKMDTIPQFPSLYVASLAVGPDGTIWVGMQNKGIVNVRPDGAHVYSTTTTPVITNNNINTLMFDQCWHLWAGTDSGAFFYDGSTWTAFNKENGYLKSNIVNDLSLDAAGHVWIATNGGIAEFKPLPEKPLLSSPPNWMTINTDSITCRWYQSCPGILAYWHEIADNPNFTNSHIDTTSPSLIASMSKWDTIFQNNTTYYWRVKAKNDAGWGPFSETWAFAVSRPAAVSRTPNTTDFDLEQNYPNPTSGATTFRFRMSERSRVSLTLCDMLGRPIATLAEGMMEAGTHDLPVDLRAAALDGNYMCQLNIGGRTTQRILQLVR